MIYYEPIISLKIKAKRLDNAIFSLHCPYNSAGDKDFKNTAFMIQRKRICMKLWLEAPSVSASRFYRLRLDFLQFGGITSNTKRQSSLSPKTLEAITWMEQYFQRIDLTKLMQSICQHA